MACNLLTGLLVQGSETAYNVLPHLQHIGLYVRTPRFVT